MNRTWKTLSEREKKIEELKYWVNMQSCDGAIDSIYIGNAEEICEELQLMRNMKVKIPYLKSRKG